MYRILCESLKNYIAQYDTDASKEEYRYLLAKPLLLLLDLNMYYEHKKNNNFDYKRLSDLLKYMQENVHRYPGFKSFLWMVESRGITGKKYNAVPEDELEEQAKLMNMFLKLRYWEEEQA